MDYDASKKKHMPLGTIISIISILIAIGSMIFANYSRQNSLEYMTKEDFNKFQLENVQRISSLESLVKGGFERTQQQIGGLQFLTTKEFNDYKDAQSEKNFTFRKDIDIINKDHVNIDKHQSLIDARINALETRFNILNNKKLE